jgi:hypothetical protein
MFKATLKDGTEISGGFIGHKEGKLIYYTLRGIGKIFKSNMTEEEKKEAELIQSKGDKFLVDNKYISTIPIAEISNILE